MNRETCDDVIVELQCRARPDSLPAMSRFGIATESALGGWSVPDLRSFAKRLGRDHELALCLWSSGIHEARQLAAMVDDPGSVTNDQLEEWAADFASWDIVDGACGLFASTRFAYAKAYEWSSREEEFVKRAAFVLMAYLAVHDKGAPDEQLAEFLPVIEREAWDKRNFVKKAVNWALRQIGKRNLALNKAAIDAATRIHAQGTSPARWIATDALRELRSDAVQQRLAAKARS
jgi:3-methyladenine DNA glycosylase AlkD